MTMKDSTFGGLMFLAIMSVVVFLAVLVNNGTIQSKSGRDYATYTAAEVAANCARRDSLSLVAQQDTAKWNAFLECSKDEGDVGCDSCFTAIYGYSLEER
jgi:hypothetical protein